MATNEDWWGYLIFVFLIVVIVIFVIKIGLEFPGLFEWKFLCSNSVDERSESEIEMDEADGAVEVDESGESGKNEREKRIDKSEKY
jgi:hypothetical protein